MLTGYGLGFYVTNTWFNDFKGYEVRIWGKGHGVWDPGFGVQYVGFRASGLGDGD